MKYTADTNLDRRPTSIVNKPPPCASVKLSHPTENVALGASPTQSSTDEGAAAEGANDGNSDNDFRHGSCSRTRKSKNPWWRVDLTESFNVSDVIITNRADCCSDQLQGAEIRIGDSLENEGNSNKLCGIADAVFGPKLIFICDGFIGRYVNVIIPGPDKILTLCEVEIFGSELEYLHGKGRLDTALMLWLYTAPQLS
ncbi:fucolectin-1-like [Leucoraja erinacea]|uniref:fucolectin-1-like n=1 Tax=Leucoraja erinaceus TaxID=7782 RepID=UPI0024543288|nr:fucolectin-1-like [Leucoraja erinacea]